VRPPTEGEALFMMISIILVATLLINGIVYLLIGSII
jgi:hypothetical protein